MLPSLQKTLEGISPPVQSLQLPGLRRGRASGLGFLLRVPVRVPLGEQGIYKGTRRGSGFRVPLRVPIGTTRRDLEGYHMGLRV